MLEIISYTLLLILLMMGILMLVVEYHFNRLHKRAGEKTTIVGTFIFIMLLVFISLLGYYTYKQGRRLEKLTKTVERKLNPPELDIDRILKGY